jgi:sporulation protein YlmC with PRC-barrel domain
MDFSKVELVGKTVMNDEGIQIGIIKKFLFDKKTGNIRTILIEPSKEININDYKRNEQGRIIIPFENVSSVQDVMIIEKEPVNIIE